MDAIEVTAEELARQMFDCHEARDAEQGMTAKEEMLADQWYNEWYNEKMRVADELYNEKKREAKSLLCVASCKRERKAECYMTIAKEMTVYGERVSYLTSLLSEVEMQKRKACHLLRDALLSEKENIDPAGVIKGAKGAKDANKVKEDSKDSEQAKHVEEDIKDNNKDAKDAKDTKDTIDTKNVFVSGDGKNLRRLNGIVQVITRKRSLRRKARGRLIGGKVKSEPKCEPKCEPMCEPKC